MGLLEGTLAASMKLVGKNEHCGRFLVQVLREGSRVCLHHTLRIPRVGQAWLPHHAAIAKLLSEWGATQVQ